MESYNRGASNAPPHYSDLSNPQIIETLQKQGGYNAQQDDGQGETQSNNENQEVSLPPQEAVIPPPLLVPPWLSLV